MKRMIMLAITLGIGNKCPVEKRGFTCKRKYWFDVGYR